MELRLERLVATDDDDAVQFEPAAECVPHLQMTYDQWVELGQPVSIEL